MEWLNEILLPEEAKRAFKEAQEYTDNKNYDLALLKLQLAITIKSNFPDFYALQGLCFYHKAMYSSATYSLKEALELNNEHKQSYYYLGLVQAAMKEYSQAIENYRKAIQFGY